MYAVWVIIVGIDLFYRLVNYLYDFDDQALTKFLFRMLDCGFLIIVLLLGRKFRKY